MDKKKLEKRLTIGLQIFALIGLIIIGFYLGKAYKARKEKNDVIKDFGVTFKEFNINSDTKKYSVKVNNKNVDIENKSDGVYLNNKKIDFSYAMGGYVLDKSLILYNVGQVGNKIVFIDKNLEVIPFDNKEWTYRDLELVNGKIQAIGYQYEDIMGCHLIHGLEICNCGLLNSGDLLIKHKDELEPLRENIISGTVKLSYDGKEIVTSYVDKETINDIYGNDLDGNTKTYCVKTEELVGE